MGLIVNSAYGLFCKLGKAFACMGAFGIPLYVIWSVFQEWDNLFYYLLVLPLLFSIWIFFTLACYPKTQKHLMRLAVAATATILFANLFLALQNLSGYESIFSAFKYSCIQVLIIFICSIGVGKIYLTWRTKHEKNL